MVQVTGKKSYAIVREELKVKFLLYVIMCSLQNFNVICMYIFFEHTNLNFVETGIFRM